MKLLVSVVNRMEALEAASGGAHIIDVKNPQEGSLGANFPRVIKVVREALSEEFEVSATLGDLPNLPGTAALAALGAAVSGAGYVKAGLYGVRTVTEAVALMREVRRASKGGGLHCKVIAAGYSDYREHGCLNPLRLPEVALKAGANGILVDVKSKAGNCLFDFLGDEELEGLVRRCHKDGLAVALAGRLGKDDVARIRGLGADIMGVRRAACDGQDWLKGRIRREAVAELVRTISDRGSGAPPHRSIRRGRAK